MPNRLLSFARLAHEVAQRSLPERAHKFAPKRYTQPQLLACLLLKEYLGHDYRTAQETLELSDGLREALVSPSAPDYSTLWRFAHDKATAEVIATALDETIERLKASGSDPPSGSPAGLPVESIAMSDSTGLFCGHASRYFEHRARRERKQRAYQKWAAALWTGPQLVVAQLSKPGPCGDYPDLPPLAAAATTSVPGAVVLADAGYDCERDDRSSRNHAFCREHLGVRAPIPAKTRRFVAGPRRRGSARSSSDVPTAVARGDTDVSGEADVGRGALGAAASDGRSGKRSCPACRPHSGGASRVGS